MSYPVCKEVQYCFDNPAPTEYIEISTKIRAKYESDRMSQFRLYNQELHELNKKFIEEGHGGTVVQKIVMYNGNLNYLTISDSFVQTSKYVD